MVITMIENGLNADNYLDEGSSLLTSEIVSLILLAQLVANRHDLFLWDSLRNVIRRSESVVTLHATDFIV